MLADILPTAYEVGVAQWTVQPAMLSLLSVQVSIGPISDYGWHLYSPGHIISIDLADSRLEAAKQFGADITVNNSREDPLAVIQSITGGLGADVTIEAVGTAGDL